MNTPVDMSLTDQVRSLQQQVSQLQSLIPGAGMSYGQGQGGVGARSFTPKQEVIAAATMSGSYTSNTWTDITGGTVNITTTGGHIIVFVVGDSTTTAGLSVTGSVSGSTSNVRVMIDGVAQPASTFGITTVSITIYFPAWPTWRFNPTAGDHVIKLQAQTPINTITFFPSGFLSVQEYFSQAA